MDALDLSGAEVMARQAAIARLQMVAVEMAHVSNRLIGNLGAPTIAFSPLAMAARARWGFSQVLLVQAGAGYASQVVVGEIAARDPDLASPALRRLALSTLETAERRLRGQRPSPCEAAPLEAVR